MSPIIMKTVVDWDGSRIRALSHIVNGQLKFEYDAFKFCIGDTCLVFNALANNSEAYVAVMKAIGYCPNFNEIRKLGVNFLSVLVNGVEAMQCESHTVMVTDGDSITFATEYLAGDISTLDITDMPVGLVAWLIPEYDGKLKYREVYIDTKKIMARVKLGILKAYA